MSDRPLFRAKPSQACLLGSAFPSCGETGLTALPPALEGLVLVEALPCLKWLRKARNAFLKRFFAGDGVGAAPGASRGS